MNIQVSISKTFSMDMQQGHDMQQGNGHPAWTYSVAIKQGHAAWIQH
jgi:hypothetical protein